MELAQAGIDERLPLLGGVVLGVLAQVAVGAGFEDFPGKIHAQLDFELRDLLLEPLNDFFHLQCDYTAPQKVKVT